MATRILVCLTPGCKFKEIQYFEPNPSDDQIIKDIGEVAVKHHWKTRIMLSKEVGIPGSGHKDFKLIAGNSFINLVAGEGSVYITGRGKER
jgi:hypothetical protein